MTRDELMRSLDDVGPTRCFITRHPSNTERNPRES